MALPRITRDHVTQAFVLALLDAAYILAAYLVIAAILQPPGLPLWEWALTRWVYYWVFLAFWFWESMNLGLWESARNEEFATYTFTMARAFGGSMVLATFVLILITPAGVDRVFLASFLFASVVSIIAFRSLLQAIIIFFRIQGYDRHRVLIIGANERTAHLAEIMRAYPYHGYEIAGFLDTDPARAEVLEKFDIPHLGPFEALASVLREQEIDEVYASLPIRSCYETIEHIEKVCRNRKVPAFLIADLFPMRIAKRRLTYLGDAPLVSLSPVPEARAELYIKRAIDFLGSSAMLIGLSPLFLLVAIAIKLDSKGPIFFFQERVGRNQRRFHMIKFRSMRTDAEELRKELEALNEADGPVFKIRNDPRITKVGRFIRKYSIDEFPQLINVFLGQMSLVGPRPPIPSEVEKYTWEQRRRLSVKPGMTGLWQVSGRSDINFEQWVELDLTYIDSWSLWQDFIILLKTFGAVVEGRGAA